MKEKTVGEFALLPQPQNDFPEAKGEQIRCISYIWREGVCMAHCILKIC